MVDEFLEFKKQYENTFIRVKFESSKDYHIVTVKACINDDEKHPYIVVFSPSVRQCSLNWADSKQSIDYSFPPVGLFNFQNSFLMFCRLPDRQFKRGISSGNSLIVDPFNDIKRSNAELAAFKIKTIFPDYNVLEAAFSDVFPISLDQAIDALTNPNQAGVALNPIFGISKNPTSSNEFILWKHLNMIGTLHIKTRTVEVAEQMFQQEVLDFFTRQKDFTWMLQ